MLRITRTVLQGSVDAVSGVRDYRTALIDAFIIAGFTLFSSLVAIGVSPDNDFMISIYRAVIASGVSFFATLIASLNIRTAPPVVPGP
jgi:VIT1/CCC1 family predicted Fe2+/Mn2+ transporter